ncbi:MAG TPA: hypothetical protein VF823_05605, partial [Anaerolineales bacterium]
VQQLSQVKAADFLPAQEDGEENPRRVLKIEARKANEALIQVIQLFNQLDIEILSIETLEPNLESVFLHLTGKSLRE